jgi:hypothetical protein
MYYEIHGSGDILPGTTHYEIFYSPTLASTVAPFLDA